MSTQDQKMHEQFLNDLERAYQEQHYFKVSWLCYSLMEQRIAHMIRYHIDMCPNRPRTYNNMAAISRRISCIQNLLANHYGSYDVSAWTARAQNIHNLSDLLNDIEKWCERRNELVHTLIKPEHLWSETPSSASAYDDEFQRLAADGIPLVRQLYNSASSVRKKWKSIRATWNASGASPAFPVCQKCRNQCKCLKV